MPHGTRGLNEAGSVVKRTEATERTAVLRLSGSSFCENSVEENLPRSIRVGAACPSTRITTLHPNSRGEALHSKSLALSTLSLALRAPS